MSRYRVKVTETITRWYSIGGVDTEDQAKTIAEDECQDGDETHRQGSADYSYESEIVAD